MNHELHLMINYNDINCNIDTYLFNLFTCCQEYLFLQYIFVLFCAMGKSITKQISTLHNVKTTYSQRCFLRVLLDAKTSMID